MLSNPLRAATLAGALSLIALAGPIASAGATVTASQITAPTDPTSLLYDQTTESPTSTVFTVEGKTIGEGEVNVRCYYAAGEHGYTTIAEKVSTTNETFFAVAKAETLETFRPCVLRAVPVGDEASLPPGSADAFEGPRIIASEFGLVTDSLTKAPYGYYMDANGLASFFGFESVGECGLEYSNLVAPFTLEESPGLFNCDAALYSKNGSTVASSTRSELQIDGANAYSPAAAHAVEEALKVTAPIPGAPQVTVTKSFNPATDLATVTEVDPIVKCSPSTAFPPTTTGCTSFVSTGVQLERTWQTGDANQVASMTDTWSSTDGAAHSLNALYDQETVNGGTTGGAYQFPGTNVFSPTVSGETMTLPAGLGKIYYKEDSETPDAGDGVHPQGAIVYDTPPSGPVSVYRSTATAEAYNGFQMPYQATIPAGGSYTIHMAFIQAYTLPEVESLASSVLAGYPPSSPPTLNITAPANGTIVSTPSVTVAGNVTDTRAITSFTVDGQTVSVGAGGAWSTTVALNQGANEIAALATDQAGFTTEKTVSVTYTPIPPVANASQVGSAHGTDGEVSFTIVCSGAAGTSCEIESTLTAVEQTHSGRPVAVSARRHHRTRSTTVTVGSSKLTIPAGERVTMLIQLNATGSSLLARFGRLPVHLVVFQSSAGQRSTIIVQNLTVTPHPRKRKQHRHRHRRR